MSPVDFVSAAGSPDTFAPCASGRGCRDVEATAFACGAGGLRGAGCFARLLMRCWRTSSIVVGAEVDGARWTPGLGGSAGKLGIGWRTGIRRGAEVDARGGGGPAGNGGGEGGGEGIAVSPVLDGRRGG